MNVIYGITDPRLSVIHEAGRSVVRYYTRRALVLLCIYKEAKMRQEDKGIYSNYSQLPNDSQLKHFFLKVLKIFLGIRITVLSRFCAGHLFLPLKPCRLFRASLVNRRASKTIQ
jgi:hypothetical protein